MSGKYYKFTNDDKKKEEKRKQILKKIRKDFRRNIIKKTIQENNFSPFMKLVYMMSI